MFVIINKQTLAPDIKRIDIRAGIIARHVKPGQYVSVCPEEGDERIPLTIIESDSLKETITLIVHEVGETTRKLCAIPIGENIFSILGPLGVPAHVDKRGTIVCIATGMGAAQILPICRALKKNGNKVIGIIGAKTKKELLLEAQMRIVCDRLFISTNDGSYERKGLATDLLKGFIEKQSVDGVYAIGSVDMMQAVCEFTKAKAIKTWVHLNPYMVDCMGMCGSCRVKVGGKTVLGCVDGPEFDGHAVDFEDFSIRLNAFKQYGLWDNQKSKPNPPKSGSPIFTKFLSGILKK